MTPDAIEPETLERPLTYEEERGKPLPSVNHSIVQANLSVQFAKHREFRVCSELDLTLGGQFFTPDLCIYRREPPDWEHDVIRRADPPLVAVEILSAMQGFYEVMRKADVYFANGVQTCWIVSPSIRVITIFTADGQQQNFSIAGVAADPATGVTADLEAVFS